MGSSLLKNKVSLVNRKDCCRTMVNGGLGIRHLVDQNKLFLLKIGYNMIANPDAFWVRILRNKYKIYGFVPDNIIRSNCSYFWRSLAKIWDEVKKGLI